jgi:hypothetical protein
MRKRILVLVLVLMMLPIQAESAEIQTTVITTFPSATYSGQVLLEEGMQMGAGQTLILPSGLQPVMAEEFEIIEANMTTATWVNLTLRCNDIKNRTGESIALSGALTIQVWVSDTLYAEAVLGRGDSEDYQIGLQLPAGLQTVVALSASRVVPEPIVPLPLDMLLTVELVLFIDFALMWDVTYRSTVPVTTGGNPIPSWNLGLNLETGILVVAFSGLVCAAVGNRRKTK